MTMKPEEPREETDIRFRPLLLSAGGLLVLLVVVLVGLWILFRGTFWYLGRKEPPAIPAAQAQQAAPFPKLDHKLSELLEEIRRNENAMLFRYEWVDREAGTVRIPIDRAMDVLSERGK